MKFDLSTVTHATGMNKAFLREARERLKKYDNDPDRKARLCVGECKFCFYMRSKIGGSMMTNKPCNSCGTVILYSSTCTGTICKECGDIFRVCTHCGGDINDKNRRKL
jgi:hypothetical protein